MISCRRGGPLPLAWLEGVAPSDMGEAHRELNRCWEPRSSPRTRPPREGEHTTPATSSKNLTNRERQESRRTRTAEGGQPEPPKARTFTSSHPNPISLGSASKKTTARSTSTLPNQKIWAFTREMGRGGSRGLSNASMEEAGAQRRRRRWAGPASLGFPLVSSCHPDTQTAGAGGEERDGGEHTSDLTGEELRVTVASAAAPPPARSRTTAGDTRSRACRGRRCLA